MHKAWAVMWSVYLASIVVVINQFKVPPTIQTLMEQLQVSMSVAGWLMSIFALAGIILAIPAAFILGKFGPKTSGLMGLGCTILGSAIGALASIPAVLLLGRVIEGVGQGLIAVVAPAVIAMWFKPQKMGLPMGIWSTWVPLGSSIAFNVAAPIEASFGWRGIWWLGALLGVIAFIVFALVVTSPPKSPVAERGQGTGDVKVSYAEGFKTPGIWLLAIGFFALLFCTVGYTTWAPVFYNEVFGIEPAKANFYTSIVYILKTFSALLCGWILTRVKNHKAILVAAILISTVLYPWGFNINSPGMIVPYVTAIGLFPVFIATTTFTLAPGTMPSPALGGLAMAILTIGQNVGTLTGPPILGSLVESSGNWASANYPMFIVMLAASVAAIAYARIKVERTQETV